MSRPPSSFGVREVSEVSRDLGPGGTPVWVHPEWPHRFPWLTQGITGRPLDYALFRDAGPPAPFSRWLELGRNLGFGTFLHSRQVHGARILTHDPDGEGLLVGDEADGHLTGTPGVLMAVTVADCVPVYLVDEGHRAVGMVHAGWRGVAEGILEEAVARMSRVYRSEPGGLSLHLGPSICGRCYEVGPEVHVALGLPDPGGPTPVDLRETLGARALALGLAVEEITRSAFCTLCGEAPFFSHRGGDPERQVGFLGIRRIPGTAG